MTQRSRPPELAAGSITITNPEGLNVTTARQLSGGTTRFASTVTLETSSGARADCRDIYSLLMLGVQRGDRVLLRCVGADAAQAYDALVGLLGQTA